MANTGVLTQSPHSPPNQKSSCPDFHEPNPKILQALPLDRIRALRTLAVFTSKQSETVSARDHPASTNNCPRRLSPRLTAGRVQRSLRGTVTSDRVAAELSLAPSDGP